MRNLKRLIVLVVALALAASVVFFTLENRTPIHLVFLGWNSPELPIALFIMSTFIIGLIVGPLLTWWPHKRLRMRYNKQAKQLAHSEQQIKELQKALDEKNADAPKALTELPRAS